MQFMINVSPEKASTLVPKIEAELARLKFRKGICPGKFNCYDGYDPEIECLMGFAVDYSTIGMKAQDFKAHMEEFVSSLDPTDDYLEFRKIQGF